MGDRGSGLGGREGRLSRRQVGGGEPGQRRDEKGRRREQGVEEGRGGGGGDMERMKTSPQFDGFRFNEEDLVL